MLISEPITEFTINRTHSHGSSRNTFRLNFIPVADVGSEGQKIIGEVFSRRGSHGNYFLKEILDENEANEQRKKYKHFQKGGVNVPKVFKPVTLPGRRTYIIIEDLTQKGRLWFLGANNSETKTKKYLETVQKIPESTRKRIIKEMIKSCEVAATPNFDLNGDNRIYELDSDVFLFSINPNNLSECNVYTADLGVGVMKTDINKQKEVLETNLSRAAVVYTWMTGKKFEFPEKYSYLEPGVKEEMQEELEYRDWHNI